MKYFDRRDNEESALVTMQTKADDLKVKGVSVVMIQRDSDTDWRPVIESSCDSDDKYNYLAIALEKLAEMVVTKQNSGQKPHKEGESGYRGGIFRRDHFPNDKPTVHFQLYTAFSGGSEDQDVAIAEAGMNAMLGI